MQDGTADRSRWLDFRPIWASATAGNGGCVGAEQTQSNRRICLTAVVLHRGANGSSGRWGPGIAGLNPEGLEASCYADESEFASQVFPILRRRCVECHGAGLRESGLRRDDRRGLRKAMVVAPGRPDHGELWRRVTLHEDSDERMPPTGDRLTGWLGSGWLSPGFRPRRPPARSSAQASVILPQNMMRSWGNSCWKVRSSVNAGHGTGWIWHAMRILMAFNGTIYGRFGRDYRLTDIHGEVVEGILA